MPLKFHDVDFVAANFLAPRAALQTLLPPPLTAFEVAPGLGLFALAFWNYKLNRPGISGGSLS